MHTIADHCADGVSGTAEEGETESEPQEGASSGTDGQSRSNRNSGFAAHAEPAGLDPLEPARTLFEEKKFAGCLMLLSAAMRASTLPGISSQQLKAQTLVCSIHLYAERGAWWQVLGLEEDADETVIRRKFRRLAQQVHPDKTRCFGAESAFKLISKAASIVTPHAGAGTAGVHGSEEYSGPKWWEAWDQPEEEATRKRQRSDPADAEAGQRSAQQLRALHALPMQGLQQEVARRQMAVLDRTSASPDLPQTMHERQASLREARSVLSQRLQAVGVAPAVPSQPPPSGGGGFF